MTDTPTEGQPAPGTPEYDAAMAAKFREAEGGTQGEILNQYVEAKPDEDQQAQKPERPAHIPEKFWDAEKGEVRVDDLVKSYTELESKGGKPEGQQQEKPDDEQAQQAVEAAGLNWDDLGAKLATKGDIDPDDYEALAKVGIPKEIVQNYAALVADAQSRNMADAMAYVGGSQDPEANEKATAELLDWAAKTLSKDEIEGYNKMLAGPQWKVAVDTLKTRRGQSGKSGEPALLTPKTAPGSGTTVGYKTEEEMRADMRNPLYFQQSPDGEKFRSQVFEKTRLAAFRQNR